MPRRAPAALLSIGALMGALLVATSAPAGAGAGGIVAGDTIVVDTTADAPDASLGDGICATAADECSLRAALEEAQEVHEDGVTTTLEVPAGEYQLTEGQLFVYNVNVVIQGAGVGETIVKATPPGEGTHRHLAMSWDGELVVTLSDMTFTEGMGESQGGSVINDGGTLTVRRMHFVGNEADFHGGAIASYGGEVIRDSLIVEDTTFAGNSAGLVGGAIHADEGEVVTVTNSTFTGNGAAFGGAIYAGTFDEEGTGAASVEIFHATFAGNSASGLQGDPAGGALYAGDGGEILLLGSIVEGSVEGEPRLVPAAVGDPIANCATISDGVITSGGWNVVDDASCSTSEATDQPDTAANVGALQDNGGPTFTMALTADSPAVDAAGATCEVTDDQRGVARPQDGDGDGTNGCDSGAFELAAVPETTTTTTSTPSTPDAPAAQAARQTPTYTG